MKNRDEYSLKVTRDEIIQSLAAKAEKFEKKAVELDKRAAVISDPVDTRFGVETPTSLRMTAKKCRDVTKDCHWIEEHLVAEETFCLTTYEAQTYGLISQGFSCGDPSSSLF